MGSTRLRARRRALTTAWERFRDTGSAPEVRPEVIASWGRSRSALTRPVEAAPLDPSDAVQAAWADSPLRAAIAEVAEDVSRTARDCDLVAAVTDGSGRILWQTGSHHMRDRAETVNFVPGGHWDEASVGTNALDLALRTGHPAMVFSAEHFNPAVHQWVCYAAPLVDRTDGTVLGVLDLSSTWERSNPMALGTVTAFARTVSHALTARELKLLEVFHERKGEVLSRDLLLNEVWGIEYLGTTRTLDQHIAQVRKKVGDDVAAKLIKTVHGVGYQYVG